MLYLLKVYLALWTLARNQGTILAIFGTSSQKSSEINRKS